MIYLFASLALLVVGAITLALILTRCRHQWIEVGQPRHWTLTYMHTGDKADDYRQDVKCTKCGKFSWVRRHGV